MCNCLKPFDAWICGTTICKRDGVKSPNIVFNRHQALKYYWSIVPSGDMFRDEPVLGRVKWVDEHMLQAHIHVPCGRCAACQIEKRKDMATRLVNEASMHEQCCFITLTHKADSVPLTPSGKMTLAPREVQLFLKRLRRHLEYQPKRGGPVRDHVGKIRYFAVGEYGGKTHRPHYHIMIFGWSPSDKTIFKVHNGKPVYRSTQIEKLWDRGFVTVSDVSPFVARYCARYVTKKFARLSEKCDSDIVPEFVLQSTRDGAIGATWFDRFGQQACRLGFVTYRMNDKILKAKLPKYYMTRLRRVNLPLYLEVREERISFLAKQKQSISIEDLVLHDDLVRRRVDVAYLRCRQEIDREFF